MTRVRPPTSATTLASARRPASTASSSSAPTRRPRDRGPRDSPRSTGPVEIYATVGLHPHEATHDLAPGRRAGARGPPATRRASASAASTTSTSTRRARPSAQAFAAQIAPGPRARPGARDPRARRLRRPASTSCAARGSPARTVVHCFTGNRRRSAENCLGGGLRHLDLGDRDLQERRRRCARRCASCRSSDSTSRPTAPSSPPCRTVGGPTSRPTSRWSASSWRRLRGEERRGAARRDGGQHRAALRARPPDEIAFHQGYCLWSGAPSCLALAPLPSVVGRESDTARCPGGGWRSEDSTIRRAPRRPRSLLTVAGVLAATALVLVAPLGRGPRRRTPRAAMPDVVGLPASEVYAAMRRAELYFTTRGPGSAERDVGVGRAPQSPAPGTLVAWHATVRADHDLAVPGHALRRVPRVVGLSRAQVYAAMRRAELYFTTRGPGSATGTWVVAVDASRRPAGDPGALALDGRSWRRAPTGPAPTAKPARRRRTTTTLQHPTTTTTRPGPRPRPRPRPRRPRVSTTTYPGESRRPRPRPRPRRAATTTTVARHHHELKPKAARALPDRRGDVVLLHPGTLRHLVPALRHPHHGARPGHRPDHHLRRDRPPGAAATGGWSTSPRPQFAKLAPLRARRRACQSLLVTHTRTELTALLRAHGLRPSRALGQNFVVDPNTVRRIARLAGVGAGDLVARDRRRTRVADPRARRDRRRGRGPRGRPAPARPAALGRRAPRRPVHHADALHADYDEILAGREAVVVANLPYNVATPLVLHLLEDGAADPPDPRHGPARGRRAPRRPGRRRGLRRGVAARPVLRRRAGRRAGGPCGLPAPAPRGVRAGVDRAPRERARRPRRW